MMLCGELQALHHAQNFEPGPVDDSHIFCVNVQALLPNISAGANLTDAALAVVDLATRSVDAALRNADFLTAKANVSQEVTVSATGRLSSCLQALSYWI